MKKIILVTVLVLLAVYVLPLNRINWGKISTAPVETVTVSGEAKTTVKNQLASFSAGVAAQNIDKNKAISEVNSKMDILIKSVKDFGIKPEDIQTQNISYYQNPKGSFNPGQWQVNNSVEITLRNIEQTQQLADLLNASGATNVYGPNFRLDDTNTAEMGLYEAAMKDAKAKAEAIARAAGRTLGKVVIVNDNGISQNYPILMSAKAVGIGGGPSTPVEAGSQTVTKNLTVSFELE